MAATFNPYHAWLGLDEDTKNPSYYQLLAIAPAESDAAKIAVAADRAATKVRSFRPGPHAGEWSKLLDEIHAAKTCLLDPQRRSAYDRELRNGSAPKKSDFTAPRPTTMPLPAPPNTDMYPPGMGRPREAAPREATPPAAAPSPADDLNPPGYRQTSAPAASSAPKQPASYSPPAPEESATDLLPPGAAASLPPGYAAAAPAAQPTGWGGSPAMPAGQAPYAPGPGYQAGPAAPAGYPGWQQPGYPGAVPAGGQYHGGAPAPYAPYGQPAAPYQGAPQGYAPTGYAPQGYAPAGYQQPGYQPPGYQGGYQPAGYTQPGYPQQPSGQPYSPSPAYGAAPAPQQNWNAPAAEAPIAAAAVAPAPQPAPQPAPESDVAVRHKPPSAAVLAARRQQKSQALLILGVGGGLLLLVAALVLVAVAATSDRDPIVENELPPGQVDDSTSNPGTTPITPTPVTPPTTVPPTTVPPTTSPPTTTPTPVTPMPDPMSPTPMPMLATTPPTTDNLPTTPTPMPTPPTTTPTPPLTPTPTPEPPPEPMPPTVEELKLLGETMTAARAALGKQQFEEADELIAKAETLAKMEEHQAKVARLKEVANYVKQFRHAIDEAVKALQPTDTFKVGTSTQVIVVEKGPNTLVVRTAGANKTWMLDALPQGVAVALADQWLDPANPVNRVIKGAYVAVDKPDDADSRQKAKTWWEEAQLGGVDVSHLMPFLTDKYDFEKEAMTPGKKPAATAKPAAE